MTRALALLALLAPGAAHATPGETLARVQATYKNAKQVSGAFAQTSVDKVFGRTAKTAGTFELVQPDKLRFDYVERGALKRAFIFDGATLWIDTPANQEVVKVAAKSSTLPMALVFLRDASGVKVAEPAPGVLVLTPVAPSTYASVRLTLDAKTATVTRSEVTDTDGNTVAFDLSGVDLAAKVDAKRFTWSAADHKNYKVTSKP